MDLTFTHTTGKAVGGAVTYDVKVPTLQGIDATIARSVNADLAGTVERFYTLPTHELSQSANGTVKVTATASEARRLDYLALFVRFDYEQDFNGAHPASFVTVAGYDLSNGKRLSIYDMFKSPTSGIKVLAQVSLPKVQALYTGGGLDESSQAIVDEGLKPSAEKFNNFIPEANGLHIVFEPYQVGPYAMGAPEIVVPWSDLQDELSPFGLQLAKSKR